MTGPDSDRLLCLVAAAPGWRVDAFAPRGSDISGIPMPSHIVAWALVSDEVELGGARAEPVFVAGERTWTPDQFRAAYGEQVTLRITPA